LTLFDEYEVPKELTEDAYDALELARDTGKIKRGSNEVTKTIERGQAKLVYLARDVEPEEVIAHLPLLCKEKGVPFIVVPSKDELGVSAGLEVSTASVAVVKTGKAAAKLKEIIDNLEALMRGEELPKKEAKAEKPAAEEAAEEAVPEEAEGEAAKEEPVEAKEAPEEAAEEAVPEEAEGEAAKEEAVEPEEEKAVEPEEEKAVEKKKPPKKRAQAKKAPKKAGAKKPEQPDQG